jgi:hypothetical protein
VANVFKKLENLVKFTVYNKKKIKNPNFLVKSDKICPKTFSMVHYHNEVSTQNIFKEMKESFKMMVLM